VSFGHDFVLYSYEPIEVPAGVQLVDASTLFAEEEVFFYSEGASAGSPSAFSNLFRYELLRRYGGWWCDTDVLCLTGDLPEQDLAFAYEDDTRINGAILKIPVGHPLACQLVSEAKSLGTQIKWGQAGPYLITRMVKLNKLENYLLPTRLIYPIHWSRALDLVNPDVSIDVTEQVRGSLFVHLWNEIFRRTPILKEVAPPQGSFLHDQFCHYNIKVPSGLTYSRYEIARILENVAERHKATSYLQTVSAERKELLAARDTALAQRNTALAERDVAWAERDNLLAACHAARAGSITPKKWLASIARRISLHQNLGH
jgi:hypothetical protein